MTMVRHYTMMANEGSEDELGRALRDLATKVRSVPACEGVEVFQDIGKPAQYIFIERWSSMDAYKAGGKLLGKEAFSGVMQLLAMPPAAASMESQLRA
jgi:quinol monooxygenase YgiN